VKLPESLCAALGRWPGVRARELVESALLRPLPRSVPHLAPPLRTVAIRLDAEVSAALDVAFAEWRQDPGGSLSDFLRALVGCP